MKRISLGIIIGAVGLTNTLQVTPQEDKATLLVNWSNNKGESKVFKIDDFEKELGNEKIHSKTFIQKYIRERGPCKTTRRRRKISCSTSKSPSGYCGTTRKGRCSGSKGLRYGGYRGGECSLNKSICQTGRCGHRGAEVCSLSRSASKGARCETGYRGGECSVSRSRSKGLRFGGYKKVKCARPIVIKHRPVVNTYVYKQKPRKQNIHQGRYNANVDCSQEKCYEKQYNKSQDKKVNQLCLEDLLKLYKLKKEKANAENCQNASIDKNSYKNNLSKYLKDDSAQAQACNKERELSCEKKDNFKKMNRNSETDKKDKTKARRHSLECKKSHNLMNINHKKNDNLLMKENNKDNLHSNDKVVEEFDKLEHFKKVCERCRSASKERDANVNKNECLDKQQKQHNGQQTKEKRSKNNLRSNKDSASNDFDYCDQDQLDKKRNYKKDNQAECYKKFNEQDFNKSCEADKFSADQNAKACTSEDNLDLVDKKKCLNKEALDTSDKYDENYLKKCQDRENVRTNKDVCEFDKYNPKKSPCEDIC